MHLHTASARTPVCLRAFAIVDVRRGLCVCVLGVGGMLIDVEIVGGHTDQSILMSAIKPAKLETDDFNSG